CTLVSVLHAFSCACNKVLLKITVRKNRDILIDCSIQMISNLYYRKIILSVSMYLQYPSCKPESPATGLPTYLERYKQAKGYLLQVKTPTHLMHIGRNPAYNQRLMPQKHGPIMLQ